MMWLKPAATYLGVTEQALAKELRAGKTPAAIAKAHGKTVAGLEQVLLTAAKKPLQDAVESKRITQAQATKIEKFCLSGSTEAGGHQRFRVPPALGRWPAAGPGRRQPE